MEEGHHAEASAAAADPIGDAVEMVDVGEGARAAASATDGESHGAVDDENARIGEDAEAGSGPDGADVPVASPIDYSTVDETPYEHNFAPGDHIIRWDMLPILWPIQIHGIVLEVSEDKSEVTICDFGVTSVKAAEDKKIGAEQKEKIVEEENAIFTEAIQEASQDEKKDEATEATDTSQPKWNPLNKKRQRLNVIKLTKWSDLRKWSKVDYEGGLFNMGRKGGGMGKGLKNLGKKTEALWTSMTKSFVKELDEDDSKDDKKEAWRSIRHDVNENGCCKHHSDVQLKRLKDDGDWAIVRKKCPQCILEDCPAMMGEVSPKAGQSSVDSGLEKSDASTEGAAPQETSVDGNNQSPAQPSEESPADETVGDDADVNDAEPKPAVSEDEPKTLAQMVAEANAVDSRSRKVVVKSTPPSSPERSMGAKQESWGGSFMKSLSNIFPPKTNENGRDRPGCCATGALAPAATMDINTTARPRHTVDDTEEKDETKASREENGEDDVPKAEEKPSSPKELPRSDPPILVLARTRWILEHGEDILPPYHIINSNSECIAVWCKTGRWSTLQASVFLHSSAIGHAKSATVLTLGVAATQPWLIPAFATVGLAAVGTPWLFLKVANDKWNEATMRLTDGFWAQAEPEVFVECIETWSDVGNVA